MFWRLYLIRAQGVLYKYAALTVTKLLPSFVILVEKVD